jgi:kynurenine formamidase
MSEYVAKYDGSGGNSPQWWPSRYGQSDRLGAANELSQELTLSALQIPKQGRIISLTRVIDSTIPIYPPRYWRQLLLSHESLEGGRADGAENDFGAFEEVITQSYQLGCHLDALGHVTISGRFYNGIHYRDNFTPGGMKEMGIDYTVPWVSRGVCLDIASLLGVEQIEPGFSIQVEHLEEACKRQNLEIRAGDAVLVHTGWGRLWTTDGERYGSVEPGVGWEGAHWLTGKRVSLVGADTWGFEPVPFENPNRPYVVHQHLIAESGTYILENVDTSELARDQISEFLFVLSPIRARGATASMVYPLALI